MAVDITVLTDDKTREEEQEQQNQIENIVSMHTLYNIHIYYIDDNENEIGLLHGKNWMNDGHSANVDAV